MRVATLTLLAGLGALGRDVLPQDQGISGLVQTRWRLASPYRVLHIVAHPDDEDGPTLTYLSRGLGAEVVIAAVTRGESGANLVTGDFFDALGILRTLEFRKAEQYHGADLRFTRFADFGCSKTLEETLSNWDETQSARYPALGYIRVSADCREANIAHVLGNRAPSRAVAQVLVWGRVEGRMAIA